MATTLSLEGYKVEFATDERILRIIQATKSIQDLSIKHNAFKLCLMDHEMSIVWQYFSGCLVLNKVNLRKLSICLNKLLDYFADKDIAVDERVQTLMDRRKEKTNDGATEKSDGDVAQESTQRKAKNQSDNEVEESTENLTRRMKVLNLDKSNPEAEDRDGDGDEDGGKEEINVQMYLGVKIVNGEIQVGAKVDVSATKKANPKSSKKANPKNTKKANPKHFKSKCQVLCDRCSQMYSNKYNMEVHRSACDGIPSNAKLARTRNKLTRNNEP